MGAMSQIMKGGHLITREPERQRIFVALYAFIQRAIQNTGSA